MPSVGTQCNASFEGEPYSIKTVRFNLPCAWCVYRHMRSAPASTAVSYEPGTYALCTPRAEPIGELGQLCTEDLEHTANPPTPKKRTRGQLLVATASACRA